MRLAAFLPLLLALAACNRGQQNNDAVRQGVIDYLASRPGLTLSGMDVKVTTVQFKGNEADADVSITPKGGNAAAGMAMKYHLEQKSNKWVVIGRDNSNPHGGAAMPGSADPHGGMPAPGSDNPHGGAGAPGKMPSPEDLPPATPKK